MKFNQVDIYNFFVDLKRHFSHDWFQSFVDLVGLKFDALPIIRPHEWNMLLFISKNNFTCCTKLITALELSCPWSLKRIGNCTCQDVKANAFLLQKV